MNWKIGQKLVCISDWSIQPLCIMPKIGEVVTFNGVLSTKPSCICLVEYPTARNGMKQGIEGNQFRPLDHDVTYDELFEKFGSPERLDSPLKPTVKIPQTA